MSAMQESIMEALGGPDVLGSELHSAMDATDIVLSGIPWRAAFAVQQRYRLSDAELARILDVSARTLSRHRGSTDVLPLAQSDRLYRAVTVLSWAVHVLEDTPRAMVWLRRPQIGLGGRIPLEIMITGTGTQQVEDLLGQIEYGVYA